jgi:hypothetical protein
MSTRETRLVSPTGGEKGAKEIRLGGADPIAMLELGRVYGMGERKYARFNYLKGYPWSLSIDALKRHLLAYEAGQDYDECSTHPGQHDDDHEYDPATCDGSGLLHTSHVAWHGLTLTSFLLRGIGQDDRFKAAEIVAAEPQFQNEVHGMSREDWDRYGSLIRGEDDEVRPS